MIDAHVTYVVNPELDALVLDYDCNPFETLSYNYGNSISETVRTLFGLMYAEPVELIPEQADVPDFVVGFNDPAIRFYGEKQMFSYDIHLTKMMEFGVWRKDTGSVANFTTQTRAQEDIYWTFCEAAQGMIDRLSAQLHRSLRWGLHRCIQPEPI
tara:strand:+ start:5992 stop:6456 length:465 start_codon:yes stop_codon:yes gene_type:complete